MGKQLPKKPRKLTPPNKKIRRLQRLIEKVISKEGQEEGNINIEERNMEKDNTEKEISTEESKNEGEWDIVESIDIKQTNKESEKSKVSAEPQKVENSEQASPADPKIQVALRAMMNMGYTNEGGWLTMLLQDKDGDIGKVLDIIQPVKQ